MPETTIKTDDLSAKELSTYLEELQDEMKPKRLIKYEATGEIIKLGIEAHKNKNGKSKKKK